MSYSIKRFLLQAISRADVWAVGTGSFAALTEHWDGHSWSIVSNPSGSGPSGSIALWSVSGSGPNDIWAVGDADHPDPNVFAEHWNGTSWMSIPPVNKYFFSLLYAVASVSPNDVWAVGYEAPSKKDQRLRTLIEHWNGRTGVLSPALIKSRKGNTSSITSYPR